MNKRKQRLPLKTTFSKRNTSLKAPQETNKQQLA